MMAFAIFENQTRVAGIEAIDLNVGTASFTWILVAETAGGAVIVVIDDDLDFIVIVDGMPFPSIAFFTLQIEIDFTADFAEFEFRLLRNLRHFIDR